MKIQKSLLSLLLILSSLSLSAQNAKYDKLQIARYAITNLYVDTVNQEKVVEDAIRGMLEKLDPHSSYTTAKETKSMTESLQGSFEGIGVQFNMVEDTLFIVQTISGGPSEKAGILAGDRIVSVNDTAIAGVKMSREEIMRRLRGPKGTKVHLGIVRRGIAGTQTFTVKRDKIPVTTVDAVYMVRPGLGYVRIGSFGATTYREMMNGVDSLRQLGMRDLILDLQDNGGGYLQAAVQIANEFLAEDDLIVYTRGRAARPQEFKADGYGWLQDERVVVLINEYSASAAEIVTGAIQDQDRGVVVGRRSFGKGLVQRPIEFEDGSMIRLTIAHYYTPSGRCIQKPYEKGAGKKYADDLNERFKNGEFYSADSIHFNDSLRYETLRKHRTVYGGGGIMPDIFVPLDTAIYTPYHRALSAKSVIINANLNYIDRNRKQLMKQYKTFDEFRKKFELPQSVIDEMVKEGEKQGVKPKDEAELQATLPNLSLQVKALIARDLWSMSEYYAIMNELNPIYREALKQLE